MKKLINKLGGGAIAAILVVLILVATGTLSWICTCGVIKFVTMCFGWTFSWKIATGIWLVMCLARTVFKSTTTVNK